MTNPALSNLTKLLATGKETALLRFSLGNELLKAADADAAVEHLRRAVALDPDYSAAWKLLARALTEAGRLDEALQTYDIGITVADRRGDRQAAKEMAVFARRLRNRIEAAD